MASLSYEIAEAPTLGGLTESEVLIVKNIAQGKSKSEIAGHLGISPRSFDLRLKKILDKTKSTNLAALVTFGFKFGLLE